MPGWGTEPWGTGPWGSPGSGDDLWDDFWTDVEGGSTPVVLPLLDRPRLVIEMTLDSPIGVDDGDGIFTIGTSFIGGPDVLGSLYWEPIDADRVRSITRTSGSTGQFDPASPAGMTLVVDNADGWYDPLNTTGPYYGQLDIGQQIRVRAIDDATGVVYPRARMEIDDIECDYGWDPVATITCSDGLAALGRADLPETPAVFDGDRSGARIRRVLDAALWPTSRRKIATGYQPVQGETYGDTALAVIQRIVDTEVGSLFVDEEGSVVFYDRLQALLGLRSTTVQVVLSDVPGTDVVEYEGLAGPLRRAETYNTAKLQRIGDGAVEQVAVDVESQNKRGILSFSGGGAAQMARSDADVMATAQFIVDRYAVPRIRFPQITVEAVGQQLWGLLLGLRRFDRGHLHRQYGPGLVIDRDVLIDGISETITPDSWQLDLTLRDAEGWSPFTIGTSFIGGPDLLI